MNSNAPKALIARLNQLAGPPNAVIAQERSRGETPNGIVAEKNGLHSLFKDVMVFKEVPKDCKCFKFQLKFKISLENSNSLENVNLKPSECPTKIRGLVDGSLEIFHLA